MDSVEQSVVFGPGALEGVVTEMFGTVYQDRTVWLSGGTGFKGAWLAEWLLALGARVSVYSLEPPTSPSLFDRLGLAERVEWEKGDIRNGEQVTASLRRGQPDFVFHLAAQPLVRLSYKTPVETFTANVMGTIHVLEGLRTLTRPCAAVLVTTDKCYENREWVHGYREEDPLGGHDPYSASKAAAELAVSSWRRSFFKDHPVRVATARAGNVIGGGDWAEDRIVPDMVRALESGRPVPVRNRTAVRPWQHVLEPLGGYLWLGAALSRPGLVPRAGGREAGAFNFGPGHDANRTVEELVRAFLQHWPGEWEDRSEPGAVHEAGLLQLATDKAHALLGWEPVWSFCEAVQRTAEWYRRAAEGADHRGLVAQQLEDYGRDARARGRVWTE
jgi:CDP-glucose 4,6-dehydratase